MQYVCSDLHGRFDRYEKLLSEIQLGDDDKLYVLGDMIDRGPDGIRILLDMMERPNIVPFLGNHEHMMLMALWERDHTEDWTHAPYAANWLREGNGGWTTLEKLVELSGEKQKELAEYLKGAFIQVPLEADGRQYVLCHGSFWGAPTKAELDEQTFNRLFRPDEVLEDARLYPDSFPEIRYDEETMGYERPDSEKLFKAVWSSPYRHWSDERILLKTYARYAPRIFINGHVPVQLLGSRTVVRKGNEMDIDGGCALAGRPEYGEKKTCLLCMRLEDEKVFSVQ